MRYCCRSGSNKQVNGNNNNNNKVIQQDEMRALTLPVDVKSARLVVFYSTCLHHFSLVILVTSDWLRHKRKSETWRGLLARSLAISLTCCLPACSIIQLNGNSLVLRALLFLRKRATSSLLLLLLMLLLGISVVVVVDRDNKYWMRRHLAFCVAHIVFLLCFLLGQVNRLTLTLLAY